MTAEEFLTDKGIWNYATEVKVSRKELLTMLDVYAGKDDRTTFGLIRSEIDRAKAKHGPQKFNSCHEGYAVLLEEVDELKAEVWKSKHDRELMRKEAIQVAAMAVRFIDELT